jgi:translation initiation factor 3 subunit M
VAHRAQCPVGEVESWVIKAIARGLVDARIDHTARTVTATRTIQREATGDVWRPLAAKLAGWRDSIAALLATVEAVGGPATRSA